MTAKLILVRGLPGSGKSTLAAVLAATGGMHLEADQFMVDETGAYSFDPRQLRRAHIACFEATEAALRAGKTVYVANTFVELWEMANYRQLALALNVPVQIIECKASFGSLHRVPAQHLADMAARWATVPPAGLPDIAPQPNG